MRNTGLPRLPNSWADYVKAIREATGLTRAELARRLDVDPTTVWRWETGRQKPESPTVVQSIATLFRLDLDEVLVAAGLKPTVEPAPKPEPEVPLDPDVKVILRRLADPDVSVEEKTNIRAMLRYLAGLADRVAERPPAKKTQPRRREAS